MAVSVDDYDDLTTFVCLLMSRAPRPGETASDRFRGAEVRCEGALGGRRWTVYGEGPRSVLTFSSEIGWDEEDYVTDRLIKSNLLNIEQLS